MSNVKNIFFDTETTGLTPGQICQISYIIESEGKIESTGNHFLTVDTMTEGAENIHKLSRELLEELSNGLRFRNIANGLYEVFNNNVLIAHNIKFDYKFLVAEFTRAGLNLSNINTQCTMQYFKDIVKLPSKNLRYGAYKNPKLEELADFFNIDKYKVMEYSANLFGADSGIGFHDSRFDTTLMYVATNIYREKQNGGHEWSDIFSI